MTENIIILNCLTKSCNGKKINTAWPKGMYSAKKSFFSVAHLHCNAEGTSDIYLFIFLNMFEIKKEHFFEVLTVVCVNFYLIFFLQKKFRIFAVGIKKCINYVLKENLFFFFNVHHRFIKLLLLWGWMEKESWWKFSFLPFSVMK